MRGFHISGARMRHTHALVCRTFVLVCLLGATLAVAPLAAQPSPARPVAAPAPASAAAPSATSAATYADLQWRNIGPFRGGRAVAVAGVRQQPRTFYFGGVGGGVWKTTDGGENWSNITDGQLKTSSVGAIAVANSDPNVVYVGMGEHPVRGVMTSHGDGVYKSTDAGRTWVHMGLEKVRQISRIRVHPDNPDLVYVAAQGAPYGPSKERGIYRSADGGKTWTQLLFVNETTGPSELAMDPSNPRVLYAAMWDHLRQPWEVRSGGPGSALYKSTDAGQTWTKIVQGLPATVGKMGIDVSANPDRLYAVVEANPGGGVYRSDDAGKSWRLMSEQWALHTRSWYYMKIFADPKNPDVVWVLNAPVSRSIDGGRTFTNVPTPHGDNHSLWINPDHPEIMIESNDGGANVTFNGGATWSTQDNQPTAQFYRVTADNTFPYRLYAGQQDNTSVAIASAGASGITEREWFTVGGCESAVPAFDPDNPRYVYAGCYMGIISEYDTKTGVARDVMAYPAMPAAVPPREQRYRFNWSAPIVVSRFDKAVIYHGGNVVLKSSDRGNTWKAISPDLTRNDKAKQGPGGTPITNEGAGGETYNTIYDIIESRHDAKTIWVATDDGYVQLTRDGGATWTNVTPPGVGEALVNAIETSPHADGTAYVAISRYKFNDFTPHVFKTTDFGKTWTRIVEGIAPESWARVVREDPVRKDLLYLGTELGFYVSFDGGSRWTPFQGNLPVTPITDLEVHQGDLLASTAGRAFWILDDLSPLRQWDAAGAAGGSRLFAPRPAVRTTGFGNGGPRSGKNPPQGAVIDYWLSEVPKDPFTLEIVDGAGAVVRRFSSARAEGAAATGPNAVRLLSAKAGVNRFVWDLRRESVANVAGLYTFGTLQGRRVVPGTYTVRLTVNGKAQSQPLAVALDPRLSTPLATLQAQDELAARVEAELTEIHRTVTRLRDVRTQVDDLIKRTASLPSAETLRTSGKALGDRITTLEDALVQKRVIDGQTVINFPMKLNQFYIYLRSAIDGSDEGATNGQRDRLAELNAQWQPLRAQAETVLGADLAAFNQLVKDQNVPAVVVQK